MRFIEIASGLQLPVSSEERELLNQVLFSPVTKDDLDERSQELARLLVSRGVLNQYLRHGKVYYRVSSPSDIWMDRDG